MQYGGDLTVRLDREDAVDEAGHLGPGPRLAVHAGQCGQHPFKRLRFETSRELHLRGGVQHEQVLDILIGVENLVQEGIDPDQFVGRNPEIVHHEFELVGDGPAHDPGLLTELRLQRLLEAGHGEPCDHDLAEQQHDDGQQYQPTEDSAGAGDSALHTAGRGCVGIRTRGHTASSSSSRRISPMAASMSSCAVSAAAAKAASSG